MYITIVLTDVSRVHRPAGHKILSPRRALFMSLLTLPMHRLLNARPRMQDGDGAHPRAESVGAAMFHSQHLHSRERECGGR